MRLFTFTALAVLTAVAAQTPAVTQSPAPAQSSGAASTNISALLRLQNTARSMVNQTCYSALADLFDSTSKTSLLSECVNTSGLSTVLTTNDSVIPLLDQWLQSACEGKGCSHDNLTAAAGSIITACGEDMEAFSLNTTSITNFLSYYPVARAATCLKINKGFEGAAPIALKVASPNSGGLFCITSLLTQLTSYLKVNLTSSFIMDTYSSRGDPTVDKMIDSIPAHAFCVDCMFGAIEVIEEKYPAFGGLPVADGSAVTFNSYWNDTCQGSHLTTDRTLPEGVWNDGDVHDALSAALV